MIEDMAVGSKMVLLMDILKECELIGDKVKTIKGWPKIVWHSALVI